MKNNTQPKSLEEKVLEALGEITGKKHVDQDNIPEISDIERAFGTTLDDDDAVIVTGNTPHSIFKAYFDYLVSDLKTRIQKINVPASVINKEVFDTQRTVLQQIIRDLTDNVRKQTSHIRITTLLKRVIEAELELLRIYDPKIVTIAQIDTLEEVLEYFNDPEVMSERDSEVVNTKTHFAIVFTSTSAIAFTWKILRPLFARSDALSRLQVQLDHIQEDTDLLQVTYPNIGNVSVTIDDESMTVEQMLDWVLDFTKAAREMVAQWSPGGIKYIKDVAETIAPYISETTDKISDEDPRDALSNLAILFTVLIDMLELMLSSASDDTDSGESIAKNSGADDV